MNTIDLIDETTPTLQPRQTDTTLILTYVEDYVTIDINVELDYRDLMQNYLQFSYDTYSQPHSYHTLRVQCKGVIPDAVCILC